MDFSDFTNKLTQVTQSPGYLKGLDMIASTRPMTGTQARIDATQAQTAQGERELGLKEQDMQREVLKGKALQEFLKSGSPEAGKAFIMLGGNPNTIQSGQLLQDMGMQSDATNAYTKKYGKQPSAGLSDIPPVMPPVAPPQMPPMQAPQQPPMQAPAQPMQAPPAQAPVPAISGAAMPTTNPELTAAEMGLRSANQELIAAQARLGEAGKTQNQGLIAEAQAMVEQAKSKKELAKTGYDKALDFTKTAITEKNKLNSPMDLNQTNAATFSDRLIHAEEVISELGSTAGTNFGQQAAAKLPLMGAENYLLKADTQRINQAKSNFINATLRRESGAAISPGEFAKADAQYFPQPGDKPEQLALKEQSRKDVINGMSRAAGATYKPPEPAKTAVPAPLAAKGITPDKWAEFLKEKNK